MSLRNARQIVAAYRRKYPETSRPWESLPTFCTCGAECMKGTEFADGDCEKEKTVLTSEKRERHYHRADEGNTNG